MLTIPGNGQITGSVETILGDLDINVHNGSYLGVIRVSSASPISVVGFYEDLIGSPSVTASLEAIDENAALMGYAAIPHLVVGQYSTQMWFFRGSDSQVPSGKCNSFPRTDHRSILEPSDTSQLQKGVAAYMFSL